VKRCVEVQQDAVSVRLVACSGGDGGGLRVCLFAWYLLTLAYDCSLDATQERSQHVVRELFDRFGGWEVFQHESLVCKSVRRAPN